MPFYFLALMLLSLGTVVMVPQIQNRIESSQVREMQLANNMLAWHQAAIAWRQLPGNAGFAGAIVQANLNLPAWYAPMAPYHSLSDANGAVATYATAADGFPSEEKLAGQLAIRSANGANGGIVVAGIVTPPGRAGTVPVPAGVPNGAVALVTQAASDSCASGQYYNPALVQCEQVTITPQAAPSSSGVGTPAVIPFTVTGLAQNLHLAVAGNCALFDGAAYSLKSRLVAKGAAAFVSTLQQLVPTAGSYACTLYAAAQISGVDRGQVISVFTTNDTGCPANRTLNAATKRCEGIDAAIVGATMLTGAAGTSFGNRMIFGGLASQITLTVTAPCGFRLGDGTNVASPHVVNAGASIAGIQNDFSKGQYQILVTGTYPAAGASSACTIAATANVNGVTYQNGTSTVLTITGR
jgi:hypothetical protein